MKPISMLFYECTSSEAQKLPAGFPFLEYDSLYESLRVIHAGAEKVKTDSRYVYLCYKEPPAEFEGATGTRSRTSAPKLPRRAGK